MFSVFRNRAFTLLWIGQLISGVGNALTALAASILVYRITGSALSVGLMLIATSGPTIVIGLIAGVFVDRYDRKRILLFSDIARGVLMLLVPFLIQFHINWLYVIVGVFSAITQFFDSAQASVLPEITTNRELSAANALMTVSLVGSNTIGFAAAGLIASGYDIAWTFYVNALFLFLSGMFTYFAHIPALPEVENTSLRAIRQNLHAGLQMVQTTPILRSLFIVSMPISVLFGLQNSLILPYSVRELGATDFHFGLVQAAETVGMTLGSFMIARLADRLRDGQWLAISYLGITVAMIFYALTHSISFSIFLMGVSGLMTAPSYIGRQLVIQRATPRGVRGRVNSAFFVVRDLTSVLGMGLAGLADVMNVRSLFVISAFALFFASALVLVLPGLGESVTQWKRTFAVLRGAEAAPRLGAGRSASLVEVERFIRHMPELMEMSPKERAQLASETLVAESSPGAIIIYRGEISSMAYFILKGSVGVGYIKDDEYVILNYLHEGDFFGEVAALTGSQRTANIIAEEPSEFLIIPSKTVQRLAQKHEGLRHMFQAMMAQRLSMIELPRSTALDQNLLRDLRTSQPDTETQSASA